jgi:uncharacterized protein YdcH (DUF465 family)
MKIGKRFIRKKELKRNIEDLGDKFNQLLEAHNDLSKYINNVLSTRVFNGQEAISDIRKELAKQGEKIKKLNTAAGIEALEESKSNNKDEEFVTLYESKHKGVS